ncbi:MAG: DUF2141 domain-containing protein [Rikenellaceae bacterium]
MKKKNIKMLSKKLLSACALLFLSTNLVNAATLDNAEPEESKSGEVTVVISAIKSGEGNLVLWYYDDAQSYYEDETVVFRKDIVSLDKYKSEKQPVITTVTLPEGKYVLFAFHDKNGDGKIEKNLLGQQMDGIGYANSTTTFKQPKFSKVAIDIVEGETKVCNINLNYAQRAY